MRFAAGALLLLAGCSTAAEVTIRRGESGRELREFYHAADLRLIEGAVLVTIRDKAFFPWGMFNHRYGFVLPGRPVEDRIYSTEERGCRASRSGLLPLLGMGLHGTITVLEWDWAGPRLRGSFVFWERGKADGAITDLRYGWFIATPP